MNPKYYPSSYADSFKLSAPTQNEPIVMETALDAYNSVLEGVGDTYPKRDTIDRRIIKETITGTASQHATNSTSTYYGKGNLGMVDTQDSIGGWPNYDSTALAPIDSDHDGIPDAWELAHGLNPADSTDGNTIDTSGYTKLELYLNELVAPRTLPLSLISFKAALNNEQQAILSWSSTNELNTFEFNIEKSLDGIAFKNIGAVKALGMGKNKNDYEFLDAQLTKENNAYYRLRIKEKSGSFVYSNVLLLKISALKSNFRILTNPAYNSLTLVHDQVNETGETTVFSIDGKKLLSQKVRKNSIEEVIDISKLKSGTYLITFESGLSKITQRFIKQ